MNDEQVRFHLQLIRRRIAALQQEDAAAWQDIDMALEDLHVNYEQMQTKLEVAMIVEEQLLLQNQQLAESYQHYYNLFDSLPIAYLVTDANGVILEANAAIAQLLNVPRRYLAGKPLALYVAEGDRSDFRTNLNQLFQTNGIQVWQMNLCPRAGGPVAVELNIDTVRHDSGVIESLRIGVYSSRESQQRVTGLTQRSLREQIAVAGTTPMPSLPQSLDGLRVLVVDDEADAREFITAALESRGISVTAVASAAAALKALEQFPPDVLVSDIRMPGGNGYSLIQQIRALEAKQGGHIPAAAITAYLGEDREKALTSGFEAHLHKLAQPSELIKMVAQLAGRASSPKHDSLN